uniref:Uncharacterized protein n=1 Tax=Magallana gigas TaxID=29159 RepID=K1QQI0_MAGGI
MALHVLLLTSMAAYHTTTIDFSSSCISFPFHPTRHFENDAETSSSILLSHLAGPKICHTIDRTSERCHLPVGNGLPEL